MKVRFHDWWSAPQVMRKVHEIDPVASHASWMENFPWTRLAGVNVPDRPKPMVDAAARQIADPAGVRAILGDGSYGGRYARPDDELLRVWRAGVEEVRELLQTGWRR